MEKNRATCKKCNVTFVKEEDCQVFCHRCIVEDRTRALRDIYTMQCHRGKKKRECPVCGRTFVDYTKRKSCSTECANKLKHKTDITVAKNKNEKANEKWLQTQKPNGKRNKKVPPFELLSLKEEKKRVFDDKGWDHYIKGRKYDKI